MKVPINLISFMAILLLLPALSLAQHHKGTVAESWDNASPASAEKASVVPLQKTAETVGSDTSPWNKQRRPESRAWPALSTNATGGDYFKANTMVIDSLARLYCLSSNYLETLRKRNEQAAGTTNDHGSSRRDFNYNSASPATTGSYQSSSGNKSAVGNKSSLQVIYKELNGLLDRCLHGR